MASSKAQAKHLLTHYFRLAANGGWRYDSDSTSEIEEIVDCLVRAAVEEIKAEIQKQAQKDGDNGN